MSPVAKASTQSSSGVPRNKRGFFRSYQASLQIALVVFVINIYPLFVMYLNPPPQESQLESLSGVIVRAQREHSNLQLRLPDGRTEVLDFPGDLQGMYAGMWPRFTLASPAELNALVGCETTVQVDRLRHAVIPTNARVWSLKCGRYSISYEAMVAYYTRRATDLGLRWIAPVISLLLLLLVVFKDTQNRKKT